MTEDQKKLVVDNIGLSHYVARRYKEKHGIDFDEAFSAAQYGLVKAAILFDPEHGTKFSTFAVLLMQQEIQLELRKRWYRYQSDRISMEDAISGTEKLQIGDLIADPEDYTGMVDMIVDIKRCFCKLTKLEREIVTIKINSPGYTQDEYSKIIGISQSMVSRYLKSARKKMTD